MNRCIRVIIVFSVMSLVTACDLLTDRCGPFDNTPFKVSAIHHTLPLHDRENNSVYDATRNFIRSNEFGILIEIEIEKIACHKQIEFSFIQSAYACSPPPLQLNGQIDSLAIYSKIPYQNELTTNDNLISLFDAVEVRTYSGTYDADSQLPAENISEYFPTYDSHPSVYLFPTEPPSGELADISFHVIIYLSGDGIHTTEFNTEPVTLIP